MVRKDSYRDGAFGSTNAYAVSTIDRWLKNTYTNLLDERVLSVIGATKFPYTPGNGNDTVTTLERAVFVLSATELGQSASQDIQFNVEGSALPIANTLKSAYLDGAPAPQWTRSPNIGLFTSAIYLYYEVGSSHITGTYGYRPCFTLPSTVWVDENLNLMFG